MNSLLRRYSWVLAGTMLWCATLAGAQTGPSGSGTADTPATASSSATASTTPVNSPSGQVDTGAVLTGQEITLQELVTIALARNPAIKSAVEHFKAQKARVPQVRTLPDPMVSAGWMGKIVPFDVQQGFAPSYRGLSVQQRLPFPGKLKLSGQIADRQAEAVGWDAEATRRQVISEVKIAYYNYFYDTKAIEITEKNKNLLEKLESIAEARYRVGKGIQQDVLRAQIEVSRIDQKLIVLQQQEETAQARLNTLLYRDPESPLPPPAPFTPAKFDVTLQNIYAMAHANDPVLERDRRTIEGSQDSVRLAQKEYEPNFTVNYAYQQRPDLQDSNGFTVGINIPVFFRSKQREGVIEASHDLIGARRNLDDRWTTVNYEIKQQYLAAQASRNLMNLYEKAIVPQSSLALESSMSAYEVGKVDFLSMLDNFIYVLDYQVDYYQELNNFQDALARLEPIVGKDLTE
jgi:cobalt-zinc-cadmium efflux system outer membrane protein